MTRQTPNYDPSPIFDPSPTSDPSREIDHKTLQAYIARGHIERAKEARRLFGALRSFIAGRATAARDAARDAALEASPGCEKAACR